MKITKVSNKDRINAYSSVMGIEQKEIKRQIKLYKPFNTFHRSNMRRIRSMLDFKKVSRKDRMAIIGTILTMTLFESGLDIHSQIHLYNKFSQFPDQVLKKLYKVENFLNDGGGDDGRNKQSK